MARPKTAQELLHVKNYGELLREMTKEPGYVAHEFSNSTVKVRGEKGYTFWHHHPSQKPAFGTVRSIIKMAVLAGIFGVIWSLL